MASDKTTFARNVRSGEFITELGTPDGPWYEVVSNRDDTLTVKTADDLEVTIPYHASSHVRVMVTR